MKKSSDQEKRVLNNLRIDEISGVDRPAQQPATVSIMKRDETEEVAAEVVEDVVVEKTEEVAAVEAVEVEKTEEVVEEVEKSETEEVAAEEVEKSVTLEDTVDNLRLQVVLLEDELTKASSLLNLVEAHRSYYMSLNGEVASEFLGKSHDEQAEIIKAAKEAIEKSDPVVYTTLDGSELRKSAGDSVIEVVKKADAIVKENSELKKQAAHQILVKKAEVEMSHIPGDIEVRVALLKAVGSIENEEVRTAAEAALKSQDEGLSKSFETVGHAGGTSEPQLVSPLTTLDKLAKAHQEEKKVSYAKAYSAVCETTEGRKLYRQTQS